MINQFYKNKILLYSFSFLLLNSLFFSCIKSDDTNYKVKGEISGLNDKSIYVIKTSSLDSVVVDTVAVKDGKFEFKGLTKSPTIVNILYSDSFPTINFIIDKDYQVDIKGQSGNVSSINIKGGAINEELNEFRKQHKTILTSRNRALEKNDINLGELKNIDFQLSRLVREYVEKNKNKISSTILIDEFAKANLAPELLQEDLNSLQGEASDFFLTAYLRKYCDKLIASSVGKIAPSIELKSTKGKIVNLDNYKGNNVLLVFDMKEAPSNKRYFEKLKETQKLLKNKVEFLAIVIDENIDDPDSTTLSVANSLDWTVLLDSHKWNSKVALKYNITTLPYMILISPDGKITERDVSLDSLRNSFENIDLK